MRCANSEAEHLLKVIRQIGQRIAQSALPRAAARFMTYLSVLRHVSVRKLIQHIIRKLRTKALRFTLPDVPLVSQIDATRFARRLGAPEFVAAASLIRDALASNYTYDFASGTLGLTAAAQKLNANRIFEIDWMAPYDEALEYKERYLLAFLEYATLAVETDPQRGLAHLVAAAHVFEDAGLLKKQPLCVPWQPLVSSRRMANLLCALSLALSKDSSIAELPLIVPLVEHVMFCSKLVARLREDDLGYNHLAGELFGQCLFSLAAGDDPQRYADEFRASVLAQVGDDGLQLERSATYHAHVLAQLLALIETGIFGAQQDAMENLACRMQSAMAVLVHPDGECAVFNDSAIGDGPSPAVLGVEVGNSVTGEWRLVNAGFAKLQDSVMTAIIMTGAAGPEENPGHGHAGFLSFELSVCEERLFVDPGVASYVPGPQRDWTRSCSSHNGPRFSGLEPMEFFGAFRVGRRAKGAELFLQSRFAPLQVAAVQNGFDRFGGRVARWLGIWPDTGLLCVDVFMGCADRDALSTFLIDGNWTVRASANALIELANRDGTAVSLRSAIGGFSIPAVDTFYPFGAHAAKPAHRVSVSAIRLNTVRVAAFEIACADRHLTASAYDINAIAGEVSRCASEFEFR